jgi:hypothetical protein
VCSVDGRLAFEIRQQKGDAFRLSAELHTPTRVFVKVAGDAQPKLFRADGDALGVRGITMVGNSDFGASGRTAR